MASNEPIAITGIGCRYPGGVTDAASFWRLLMGGVDAITEIPSDRWNIEKFYDPRPGTPGKSVSKWGGFVEHIAEFDAAFFRISPREAPCVDPQQRLVLLTAWEALEDAGETLETIRGTNAGVFVGVSANDYCTMQASPAKPGGVDVWTATGGLVSIVSNRVSFCFDLHGPSISVDTACSSSLVALHLACESLRRGECPLALVGGVNALLLPTPFINFSTANMLSPDGRCKAFDASANGYVRAEGAGVVVLKPLGAAVAARDLIYAVIHGTAANQDGRNAGMTIPSLEAQADLVRQACRRARIEPHRVQYVEAHGTGTAVGDPVEAGALGAVLADGRPPDSPCLVGSVKTNIGHLESGAGVAGVIKTALTLHHGEIPPNLHCETLNPRIDFDGLKLKVVRRATRYRDDGTGIFAGVNSFGFGGANAHAVLGSVPREPVQTAPSRPQQTELLVLSAHCSESLRQLAARYALRLRAADAPALSDVCHSAATRRTHHAHRLALLGTDNAEVVARLDAFAKSGSAECCWDGEVPLEPAPPVFVFCGQGSQRPGMGLGLYAEEPVFRETIDRCARVFRSLAGWDLVEELEREEDSSKLDITEFAQPAIFAVQAGLVALLECWGIRPAAVTGHSVGEVAAAHASGALDLETASRVVLERARSMDSPPCEGRMLSASMTHREALDFLRGIDRHVAIGAINSPKTIVFSGDRGPLEDFDARLRAAGIVTRWLPVKYSFHSHHVDPSRTRLLKALAGVRAAQPGVRILSTVHGGDGTASDFDAGYWWANVRHPVFFAGAIRSLARSGHRLFVEIGAQAVLSRPVIESLSAEKIRDGRMLATLRRSGNERAALLETVGRLHLIGVHVDWRRVFPEGRRVRLPSYAWNVSTYWREDATWRASRLDPPGHPLLGPRLPGHAPAWQSELCPGTADYLQDHRVRGQAVLPAAAYVETALAAARSLHPDHLIARIEDLDFRKALVLSSGGESTLLRTVARGTDWEIQSSNDGGGTWSVHAGGSFASSAGATSGHLDLDTLRAMLPPGPAPDEIYPRMAATGLEFGDAFRGIKRVWRRDGEALAEVSAPVAPDARYGIHPASLDSCLQVLSQAIPSTSDILFLPVGIREVVLHRQPGPDVWCRASVVSLGARLLEGDVQITDADGNLLVSVRGLVCRALGRAGGRKDGASFYDWEWVEDAADDKAPSPLPALWTVKKRLGPRSSESDAEAAKLGHDLDELASVYLADAAAKRATRGDSAKAFLASHPQAWPQVAMLASAAEVLASLASGEKASAPGWTPAREALAMQGGCVAGDLVCAALRAALQDWPAGRTLRALVVGADSAGSAAKFLGEGSMRRTELVVADPLREAAAAIAAAGNSAGHVVWNARSDDPPSELPPGSFDLVVMMDARGMSAEALARICSLLRPGGMALLGKTIRASRFEELAFGLTRSCAEEDHAASLLTSAGFSEFSALVESDDFSLLAARAPLAPVANRQAPPSAPTGSWLLLAGSSTTETAIANALTQRGDRVVVVRCGSEFAKISEDEFAVRAESPDDFARILEDGAWAGAIHLWSLDASPEDDWEQATSAAGYSLAPLARALGGRQMAPRLFVVTRGAQAAASGNLPDALAGTAWGFARVLMNEAPRLRTRLIDLDPSEDATAQAKDLLRELGRDDGEDEVALRNGARQLHRLSPAHGVTTDATGTTDYVWALCAPGDERGLVREALSDTRPGPSEIEVEIAAAGVNFRDVMKSLGIYPANRDEDFLLGDEFAGRVVAVGEGVSDWKPGDEVMAIAPGCFASRVRIPARAASRKPPGLDFASAATVPVAFLTAWYGLRTLGRLRAGETVLIHAAAGGVGLAAIQVARLVGANVIATAGSPEKRAFLRALGVEHVLDSRGTTFGDEARALTGGRGVDVVLNSLAGEAIARGLACLAPHGRFIEIGKRDIYANSALGLRPFRHSISLVAFDLAEVLRYQPELCSDLLAQIGAELEKGTLYPLPHRVFAMDDLPRAFREMSQGRHIGKLVMARSLHEDDPEAPREQQRPSFRPDATYLVTGGTRGFGLAVAEWMARQGARHLLLASRSGTASPETPEAIARLEALGARPVVAATDVGYEEDVRSLIAAIPPDRPLAGIYHAAAVIEDATVQNLEPDVFRRVMRGKARGAWNLHRATAALPLDHFVLFSSVALTVGNPGQAAYCAANGFLAGLAMARRAQGLPALCIDWGAISLVGHAARQEGLAEVLERSGFPGLSPDEATRALGELLGQARCEITAAKIDWHRAAEIMPAVQSSPRFSRLVSETGASEQSADDLHAGLRRMTPDERSAAVRAEIATLVARVARIAPDALAPDKPLQEIGFDSLMAIELVNLVERRFDLTLPAAAISSGVTASQIAESTIALLGSESRQAERVANDTSRDAIDHAPASAPGPATTLGDEDTEPKKETPPHRAATWKHNAEAAALRGAMSLFHGKTRPQAHRLLRRLLPAIRPFLRNDMRWAHMNLRAVFGPALNEGQRRRLASLALEHHLLSYVEGLCAEGVAEEFENYDGMLEAHARGRGVILCGVHLGSWEPLLRWGPRFGLPLAGVYRPAHNPLADQIFQKARAAYGVRWLRGSETSSMVSALADGFVLGMMTDLNTYSGGVFADFLGLPASCLAGPAALALHTGAPLVPAVAVREGDDVTRIMFGRPLDPSGSVTGENIAALTRRINGSFEPWILEYAEQYNWLHPRWRARPDGKTWTLSTSDEAIAAARVAPWPAIPARLLRVLET